MNMMAHGFKEKIAQFDELTAAYDRIDELSHGLARARDFIEKASSGTFYDENADEVVDAIDDVLDPHKVIGGADEAFRAVFLNGC